MKKIYLAGPEVFLENGREYGEVLKQKCLSAGFEGLFPFDNVVQGNTKEELAQKIKDGNIKLIKSCDIVIANLSPFRGPEPDSGTVWEVGFAQGLGKVVIGYCHDRRELKTKTQEILGLHHSSHRDGQNLEIEDFGLTHNLMYADVVQNSSFDECLESLCRSPLSFFG
ncbi:MAG: nucleoside 2-deoxyribosyltransferase [Deltaproteobacteria bacterium]|nr:MAG: nucleoside 2-deoxyribosyltransferase [Deltaproteobacteria bacterium]